MTKTTTTSAELTLGTAARIVLGVPATGVPDGTWAWVTGRAARTRTPVLAVHAWTPYVPLTAPGMLGPEAYAFSDRATEATLATRAADKTVRDLRALGIEAEPLTLDGGTSVALTSVLRPNDEVVAGTHGGSCLWHALGAHVVHHLLRHAPCPVVVVPDDWAPSDEPTPRVVIAYDATPAAEAALGWAIGECVCIGGRLEVARATLPQVGIYPILPLAPVIPLAQPEEPAADLLSRVRVLAAVVGITDVTEVDLPSIDAGSAAALVEHADGAHALVVGNHRAGWLSSATGYSVTESAAVRSTCPVVAVPAPEAQRR